VPEVLSTARGRTWKTVLKTEGTVFPNTVRPRPGNNVFFFFSSGKLLKQFHTVRMRLTFSWYLKQEIQLSLILEMSNEGFTFHGYF